MCSRQLEIKKYYRLSAKNKCETENVSILIDTSCRHISVVCQGIEKEMIMFYADKTFPKMRFRDLNLYVIFNDNSNEGFRLSFDSGVKDEFLTIMHSVGCLLDVPVSGPPPKTQQSVVRNEYNNNPVDSRPKSCPQELYGGGSQYRQQQMNHPQHRVPQPQFVQQSTPAPHIPPPRMRRDATDVFSRSSNNYSNPQSSSTQQQPPRNSSSRIKPHFTSSMDYYFPYSQQPQQPQQQQQKLRKQQQLQQSKNPRGTNSFHNSHNVVQVHDFGESVQPSSAKRMRKTSVKDKPPTTDAETQCDVLVDELLEDKKFMKGVLWSLMENDQFAKFVGTIKRNMEERPSLEWRRLHWKTNPKLNSSKMPPPLIHMKTSEMEKDEDE